MLTYEDEFLEYIMNCSTKEFITTLIYIFKKKYPINYSNIRAELSWDEQKEECIEGKCFRKAADIKSIYFIEDEGYYNLNKVKLEFTSLQPDAKDWVKQGLPGKTYQEQNASGETVFLFRMEFYKA